MEIYRRPAVRIVCLDAASRVLLMLWSDPSDGELMWEPPGGGIEAGETPWQAACRELVEETGLDAARVGERSVTVERDSRWNGRRRVGPEPFFLARFDVERPSLSGEGLMPDEHETLRRVGWFSRAEVEALPEALQPPHLVEVIAALDPEGPWA